MNKKRILVIGATGQIGTELVPALRLFYGRDNVVAAGHRSEPNPVLKRGPFEWANARKEKSIRDLVDKYKINTIYHMAAMLSADCEKKPKLAWDINVGTLEATLEVARKRKCSVFFPSSIGAFGPGTPLDNTPQDTVQKPDKVYGKTKVCGEALCDMYYERYGVDTRGLRYPGIISNVVEPGGGTTDYAVHIFYEALRRGSYTCYLDSSTYLDMMYMPDAINAAIWLMEADPKKLIHRNAFNITAMSFCPAELVAEIRKYIPSLKVNYQVDPVRQNIADGWPNKMDDSCARGEWGWQHQYDLPEMTKDMIGKLKKKIDKEADHAE